jgi:hypothetical protein
MPFSITKKVLKREKDETMCHVPTTRSMFSVLNYETETRVQHYLSRTENIHTKKVALIKF